LEIINTDDLNLLEFAFGKSVGISERGVIRSLVLAADERGEVVPWIRGDGFTLNAEQWARESMWQNFVFNEGIMLPSTVGGLGEWPQALVREGEFLSTQGRLNPEERLMFWPQGAEVEAARVYRAQQMAMANDPDFEEALEVIRDDWPIDVMIFRGLRADGVGEVVEAADYFIEALRLGQENPWVRRSVLNMLYGKLNEYFRDHRDALEGRLEGYFEVLSRPLASGSLNDQHRTLLMQLAPHLSFEYQERAVEAWGVHYPWDYEMLLLRERVWARSGHPQLSLAERELAQIMRQTGRSKEMVESEDSGILGGEESGEELSSKVGEEEVDF